MLLRSHKGHRQRLDDRLRRCIRNRGTEVIHRARQDILFDYFAKRAKPRARDVLKAEQLEQRRQVLRAIHDGRGRQKPALRNCDMAHEVRQTLSRRTAVRLVANEAIPRHHCHELVLRARELVADEIEVRSVHQKLGALLFPGDVPTRDTGSVNGDLRVLCEIRPLIQDGHRRQKERVRTRARLKEAEHLNRLAEAHLVA